MPDELKAGDCWIALSLAASSGLILSSRVGKHTDRLAQELVVGTEGKTDCLEWNTDGWGGYERILSDEVDHYIIPLLLPWAEKKAFPLRFLDFSHSQ